MIVLFIKRGNFVFKNSYTIGKIFDIPIKLHISFLLIFPFLVWSFGNNLSAMVENNDMFDITPVLNPYFLGLILVLALFASVLFHELAHSLVARKQGIEIKGINLLLLGGIAEMDELNEETKDEASIALAGPAFSLALGLILFFSSFLFGYFNLLQGWFSDLVLILYILGFMNVFLAIFNLLPAFPTDGGRILRALLARKIPYLKATRIAVSIGKAFAIVFGFIGFVSGNFILVFIAFYIFISASQESHYSVIKDALSEYSVGDLMTEDVSIVEKSMSVNELVDKMLYEKHSGFPVIDEGILTGIVTMEDVQSISPEEYRNMTVGDIMVDEIKTVSADDDIFKAFKLLFQENIGRLIVVEDGKMSGIITRSDIMKGFRLLQMRRKR